MQVKPILLGVVIAFFAVFCFVELAIHNRAKISSAPIRVDFCFLSRNSTMFYGQRVTSSAHLVRSVHGQELWNPACADDILTFRVVGRDPKKDALRAAVFNGSSFADIPITFTATVNKPSKLDALRVSVLRRFRIAATRREDLTVDVILSED